MENEKSIAEETSDTNFKSKWQQCESHRQWEKITVYHVSF